MASQGPTFPTTGADAATIGTIAWSNPDRITADDASLATAAVTTGAESHELQGSGFGFTIPAGATINGIVAEWKFKASLVNRLSCDVLCLYKHGSGTRRTTSPSGAYDNWPTTIAYATAGGVSDLWGTTWTPADINGSGFTAAINALDSIGGATVTASVDCVRVTVYYTLPSSLPKSLGSSQAVKRASFF